MVAKFLGNFLGSLGLFARRDRATVGVVGPVLELVCNEPVLDELCGEVAGVEAVLDFAWRDVLENGDVGGVEACARLRGFLLDLVKTLEEGVGREPFATEIDLRIDWAEGR